MAIHRYADARLLLGSVSLLDSGGLSNVLAVNRGGVVYNGNDPR